SSLSAPVRFEAHACTSPLEPPAAIATPAHASTTTTSRISDLTRFISARSIWLTSARDAVSPCNRARGRARSAHRAAADRSAGGRRPGERRAARRERLLPLPARDLEVADGEPQQRHRCRLEGALRAQD